MMLDIHRFSAALCLSITWLTAACDRPAPKGAGRTTVDTVGATIVVQNPDARPPQPDLIAAPAAGDAVLARPIARVGAVDGTPEETFGLISSIAADPGGRLYVSDAIAEDVRVFSPRGEYRHRIGRAGDGPGEFRRPYGSAVGPAGELYVADETRVQRFKPTRGSGGHQYEHSFPGPVYGFGLTTSRVGATGRYYVQRVSGRVPEQRYFYIGYDHSGAAVDTLSLPGSLQLPVESAILRTGRSGGRMIPGLSLAPFTPIASWALTPEGTLLVSQGTTYEIVEITGSGDTVRVIRKKTEPRTVPRGEYQDSLRAVRARVAAAPAPLDRLEGVAEEIRTGRLPRNLPEVLALHVATDGRIWVQRWTPEGHEGSAYDVFSREGTYLSTVLVPARFSRAPSPVFTSNRVYGVVLDEETEVQQVGAFEVSIP
jgi:hypothetical protein